MHKKAPDKTKFGVGKNPPPFKSQYGDWGVNGEQELKRGHTL